MRIAVLPVILLALAGGCTSLARNSSEAAWARGQCEQVIDQKLREKCMERVEREYGSW